MEGLKKSFLIRGNNIVGFSDKNFSTCPIGTVLSYAGNIIPRGFLACDGASYKVVDYPDLYAVIGNTYGGDTENFNVPTVQPPALTMVYIIKAFHTNEGVDSGVSDDVINYINNSNSYSTEETLTGGKWIDGKPIYRKTISFNLGETTQDVSTPKTIDNIPNISAIIDVKGYIKWAKESTAGTVSIPYTHMTGTDFDQIFTVYNHDNGDIKFSYFLKTLAFDNQDAQIVIEYIKK